MRILQVNHGFPPEGIGGTECYVETITRGLHGRGHSLHAFVGSIAVHGRSGFDVEVRRHSDREIEVCCVHRGDLFFDRWDKAYHREIEDLFRSYLASRRPDVIHLHQWMRLTSNLCAIAAELGIPAVVTLHEFHATCPRLFRTRPDLSLCDAEISLQNCGDCAERWPFQSDAVVARALSEYDAAFRHELHCARRILAPSRSHAASLTSLLGYAPGRIEALPLGRHTDLAPAPRSESQKLQFVYFSQLYPHKGARLLLEAYREMQWRERVELQIFGGEAVPEFAAELRGLAEGLDVTFHGSYQVQDLEAVPMDLVILPTLVPESWCFILDEAACLRVPVLAADVGAIPERATAFVRLFKRGDVGSLREEMDRIAEAPDRLDDMRRAEPIRSHAMGEHLDSLEGIYRDLVGSGARDVDGGYQNPYDPAEWDVRESCLRQMLSEDSSADAAQPVPDPFGARTAEAHRKATNPPTDRNSAACAKSNEP